MQHRREVPSGFLQRLSDPGYRLHGENPATATLDDARRWASIYETLIVFKRQLLDLCHRFVNESDHEVARAIRDTDMILLEVQISRFEQKRDYWKIRATELAGNGRRGVET
jgi:hypothetical protein